MSLFVHKTKYWTETNDLLVELKEKSGDHKDVSTGTMNVSTFHQVVAELTDIAIPRSTALVWLQIMFSCSIPP